jgi:hypothetical protein
MGKRAKLVEPTWQPLERAGRAAIVLLGHTGLCSLAVLGVWSLELLTHSLWGSQTPMLFDVVQLKFVFHAADAGIFGVFMFYGVVEANAKMRGH